MGNFWQDLRETAHRIDPIGANLVDNMIRTDSRVAAEVSRGADRLLGRPTPMGRLTRDESRRNIKDPSRAVGRAAATLALMYGAYSAYGAVGGGAGAAAAGGGSAGTAAGGYSAGAFEGYAGTQAAGGSLAAGAGTGTLGGGAGSAAGYGFTSELATAELLGGAAAGGAAAGGGAAGGAVSGAGTQTAATTPTNVSNPVSPYRRAAESIGTGIATNYVTSLLAPKPDTPQVEPVTPMPDPEAQAAARKRKAALRARQGRVSSILTAPGGY